MQPDTAYRQREGDQGNNERETGDHQKAFANRNQG